MTVPLWERGQEGGRTRPINQDNAYKNLCEIYDILQYFGVKCCLSHGTLLGAYRENNIIDTDDDVDLWADIDSVKDRIELEDFIRKRGFYVPPLGDKTKPVNPKENAPYSDTVAIKNGEKVEVWWFKKEGDYYYYDIYRPNSNQYIHHQKFYEPLSSIDFRGKKFNIPSFTEEWLVMAYGENWKIPNSKDKYFV